MKDFIKKLLREELDNKILLNFCKDKINVVNKIYNSINGFDLTDEDKEFYINKLNEINKDFDKKELSLINLPNFDKITYESNKCNMLLFNKVSNLIEYLEDDEVLIDDKLFKDVKPDIILP